MKRTLKRELKVREIVKRETLETSILAVETVLYLFGLGLQSLCAGQHQFERGGKSLGEGSHAFGC